VVPFDAGQQGGARLGGAFTQGRLELSLPQGALQVRLVAQARTTLLPRVERHHSLRRALTAAESQARISFDEGGVPWDTHPIHAASPSGTLWLALGPERGWSPAERALLAEQGWQPAGLGPRTLRTETACALALGIAVLKGWT
jgi:16S rRNA (uracil1498-N3)-methyltransferase